MAVEMRRTPGIEAAKPKVESNIAIKPKAQAAETLRTGLTTPHATLERWKQRVDKPISREQMRNANFTPLKEKITKEGSTVSPDKRAESAQPLTARNETKAATPLKANSAEQNKPVPLEVKPTTTEVKPKASPQEIKPTQSTEQLHKDLATAQVSPEQYARLYQEKQKENGNQQADKAARLELTPDEYKAFYESRQQSGENQLSERDSIRDQTREIGLRMLKGDIKEGDIEKLRELQSKVKKFEQNEIKKDRAEQVIERFMSRDRLAKTRETYKTREIQDKIVELRAIALELKVMPNRVKEFKKEVRLRKKEIKIMQSELKYTNFESDDERFRKEDEINDKKSELAYVRDQVKQEKFRTKILKARYKDLQQQINNRLGLTNPVEALVTFIDAKVNNAYTRLQVEASAFTYEDDEIGATMFGTG